MFALADLDCGELGTSKKSGACVDRSPARGAGLEVAVESRCEEQGKRGRPDIRYSVFDISTAS